MDPREGKTRSMAKSTAYRSRERAYASRDREQGAVEGNADGPSTTLMVVGILSFIVLFWSVGTRTLISYTALFRWFALFAFAGDLLPMKWVTARFRMDRSEWVWFNLLAVGPLLIGSCLLLNFFVHGPEQRMLVHAKGGVFHLHPYWQELRTLPPHAPWPSGRDVDPAVYQAAMRTARPGDVVIGLAEGLLGYLVITEEARVDLRSDLTPQ